MTMETLTALDGHWVWLAVGLALLLLELTTGSLWLLWPGLAALAFAGVAALAPGLSPAVQLVGFAALAVLLTLAGRKWFRAGRGVMETDRPDLNRRSAQLIGRRAAAAGAFENGYGAAKLDDGQWRARLAPGVDADVPDGAPLIIRDVDGATLVVEPA